MRGTMKVDHLAADVNGTGGFALPHFQTQAAIEGQHGLRVLHRKCDVIETPDASCALCHCPKPAHRRARGGYTPNKSTPGRGQLTSPHWLPSLLRLRCFEPGVESNYGGPAGTQGYCR